MKIVQDFIPIGRRNRPAKANPCTYITIHNTGNTGYKANAKNHANYIKSDSAVNALVSWHYTVDDTEIYQHLPDNETAYHAGDGSGAGNTKSIGIEICMNSDGNLLNATNNAVELVADLCKKHNIPIVNIVQHNRWSGKNCPQMIRSGKPYNWDTFINKVNELLNSPPPPIIAPDDYVNFNLLGDIVNLRGKIIDDISFVSARSLLEYLGFVVYWNNETRTVVVEIPDSTVKIDLFGEKIVDIPGYMIKNRNYVALRGLMEVMGYEVEWIQENQTVVVKK